MRCGVYIGERGLHRQKEGRKKEERGKRHRKTQSKREKRKTKNDKNEKDRKMECQSIVSSLEKNQAG